MATRYEHGSDFRSRTQDGADAFRAVRERRPITTSFAWIVETPDETRFGDPHRRNTRSEAEMAGATNTPQMGEAMAVAENDIGFDREISKRIEHHGYLAKRQQARNVRETHRSFDHNFLAHLEFRKTHAAPGHSGKRAASGKPSIDTRHVADRSEPIVGAHARRPVALQRHRFRRSELPLRGIVTAQIH